MSNSVIIQELKLRSYPLNSYYSYKNTEFLEAFLGDGKEYKQEEILEKIYDEIRAGFMTTKLDTIKQQANIHWNEKDTEFSSSNKIEKFYFDSCASIANKFFEIKNGQIYINGESKSENDEVLSVGKGYNHKFEWNIIKHMIDQEVLIGAYLIENGFDSVEDIQLWDSPIFTTETLLEKVLNKGVAELHMHLGATKNFASIWVSLMNNKGASNKEKKLSSIKIPTYDGVKSIGVELSQAKIVRFLLSSYLQGNNDYKKGEWGFCRFLKEKNNRKETLHDLIEENEAYYNLVNSFSKGEVKETSDMTIEDYKLLLDNLRNAFDCEYRELDIKSERFENEKNLSKSDEETLQNIIKLECSSEISTKAANEIKNAIFNKANKDKISGKQYFNNIILGEDILTYVFKDYFNYNKKTNNIEYNPKHNIETIIMPESILIFEAMKYLKECNHEDTLFAKAFWQYIKLKNITYNYIIQRHTSGKGLDIFSKIYKRQSSIYKEMNKSMADVFYSQIRSQNIKKLEFRTSFIEDKDELKKFLLIIFNVYKEMLNSNYFINKEYKAITLIGIVFHFIKGEENIYNKCLLDEKEEKSLEKKYLREAEILSRLRQEIPQIDNYIVGVDAASKELGTPPYIFKKAYKELRSFKGMKTLEENTNPFVREIGFTYHVGEDFRDIVSGLRQVDETIEELEFKSGDRIGHGIVIGIDIDKWAQLNNSIYLKADEYLDNLLWEWNLYTKNRDFKEIENISYIEREIYKVVDYIFGFSDGLRICDLYNCYDKKRKRECINRDGEKDCGIREYTKEKYDSLKIDKSGGKSVSKVQWTRKTIYEALSCSYFLKEMKKNVLVNIDVDTITKYKKLQSYMKKKISDKQIIIEINPTSNLLIGDFRTFEDYHIKNLSSPKKQEVIVTINTDDPVIFNTKINNEYALIYDIMMKSGEYESKEVIEWLDRLRRNGLDYSFIEDRKLTREELIEEIDVIIEALKI